MIFTLPTDKKTELVAALRSFTASKSKTLREWQSMLGWASWGLNSFPLGRWALQSAWEKIAGKSHRNLVVPHNKDIQDDLRWLADRLEKSDGNHFINLYIWTINDADFICTTDACTTGLGIWIPNSTEGFHESLSLPSRDIFWAELAAACHGILIGIERGAKRILICSDLSNVCDLFLTHHARPKVQELFKAIISKLILAGVDARISHLPGKKNKFADALSRGSLDIVHNAFPRAKVEPMRAFKDLPEGGFPSCHNRNVIAIPKRTAQSNYRGRRR